MKPAAYPSLWRPLEMTVFRQLLVADIVSDARAFMQNVGAAWLMVSLGAGPIYVAADTDRRFSSVLSAGSSRRVRWRYFRPTQADPFHGIVDDGYRVDSCDPDYRRSDVAMDTAGADLCTLSGRCVRNAGMACNPPGISAEGRPCGGFRTQRD